MQLLWMSFPSYPNASVEHAEKAAISMRKTMQQVEDSAIQHMFLVNQTIMASAHAAFEYLEDDTDEDDDAIKLDHRWLPRNERKEYDRDFVLIGLNRDYLGPKPLFDGREFDTMFSALC